MRHGGAIMTNATMILLSLVVGLILGLGVAFVLRLIQGKADIDAVIDNVLKLAKDKLESERQINVHELDAKKGLIDQQLQSMTGELEKVSKLMRDLERDRVEKFGQLANQLQATNAQTAALIELS